MSHGTENQTTDLPAAAGTEELRKAVERLTERLERFVEDDKFKEEQIKKLHSELQDHKRGLFDQALLPVLTQLVSLHENLNRQERALKQKNAEDLGPERLFKEIAGMRDELEVILSESGIAIFEHPSNTYDPARQTARETILTPDAALHGLISERILPGYERNGRILAKERIKVYVHRPTMTATTSPTTSAESAASVATVPNDNNLSET